MTNFNKKYFFFSSFLAAAVFLYACKKDAWDDHNKSVSQDLSKNLLQVIAANPSLTKFNEYLQSTGYDDTLALSKSFTVWAPNDDALSALDPATINTPEKLKKFVAYHISYDAHFTSDADSTLIIKTLQGKRISFAKGTFEEAGIVKADQYVQNGVLHVINGASEPKLNAWEFILQNTGVQQERNFLDSLKYQELDTSKGVILYFDPSTKRNVYQAGTTKLVEKNYYFQRISDLTSEDSLSTYIILTDAALKEEQEKLKSYYTIPDSAAATIRETKWAAVRDLVIPGIHSASELAGTVTSLTGVKIQVAAGDIVETRKLSNGVAYIVNHVNYQLMENKIPTLVIQGEYPDSLRTPSGLAVKVKKDAAGVRFSDISVGSITSSPDPLYFFRYRQLTNSVKYKVYVRAINDLYNTPISMRVDISSFKKSPSADLTKAVTTGYFSVEALASSANPYADRYVGSIESKALVYGYLYLVSAATGVTSTTPTGLSLDYIKLVPYN